MTRGGEVEGEQVKLIPRFLFDDIYAIDPSWLRAQGVRLLLADLDNTLIPYGEKLPPASVRTWKEGLEAAGVTLFLLSNSRKPGRAARFAQALGIPYEGHAGKPKGGGFRRAMARMGAQPAQTAIVGDQIFTDVWGGNRAGVLTLMDTMPWSMAGISTILVFTQARMKTATRAPEASIPTHRWRTK